MSDITIKNVRFSYCNLFQPSARPGQDPKYSVTVLVPKTNAAAKQAIDAAINDAINAGVARAWNGVRPPQPSICVHDGDGVRPSDGAAYGPECKGCWVFTASSKNQPFVVDRMVAPIIDPTKVYSGVWGNISVSFYPYNYSGKKGIGGGLNGVQVVRDGEPLASRVTAETAFTAEGPAASYGAVDPITGQPLGADMPW